MKERAVATAEPARGVRVDVKDVKPPHGKRVGSPEPTNTIFGEWVERMRTIRGLTLVALAERSGLDIKTLHYWERGKVGKPHPANVQKLAMGLGVEPEVIFTVIADSQKLDALHLDV